MKIIQEFKAFAMKGNVLDLAVAVIIGAAFGRVVSSFVNDILMPPLGFLLGGVDFKDLSLQIKAATEEAEAVTINYGMFIQNIVDFLIIAFVIFMMIKAISFTRKREVVIAVPPPGPTKDQELLTEIRDLLKKTK
jgi:large conductance mechanosensitive channel